MSIVGGSTSLPVEVISASKGNGLLSPIERAVTGDGIVGKWFVETMSLINARNIANPTANTNVFGALGPSNLTRVSAAFPNPLPVVDAQHGPYLTMRTTAVANNVFSMTWNAGPFMPFSQDPAFISFMRTGAVITAMTLWEVMSDQTQGGIAAVPLTDVLPAGASGWGFRFNAAVDGGWVGFTRTTANVLAFTSVLSPVLANTNYDLKAKKTSSGIEFSVNGLTAQTLPSSVITSPAHCLSHAVITHGASAREYLFNSDLQWLQATS